MPSDTRLLPVEVTQGDRTVPLLAVMAFLAPAAGAPIQEWMQDSLKSTVVVLATLLAAFLFFWGQRERREPLRAHVFLVFPLILLVYALGSMVWSHPYLAGVEAVRWFMFGLLLWLGINTLSLERVPMLAWGIHLGAVGAGLWAALQFWFDLKIFAQGPNPGSTFVNRNFFAEFVACAIPFGFYLLARARSKGQISLLAVSNGFVMVTLMMAGTRSALVAMWLTVLVVLPLAGWWLRRQLPMGGWTSGQRWLAAGLLVATVGVLGALPTGNPLLVSENRGLSAIERGLHRTGSIQLEDESLGYRFLFLRETATLVRANPLAGVGAGAWDVAIARYQSPKVGIESHGYAHNEWMQIVAEYGLAGALALLVLLFSVLRAAWTTLTDRRAQVLAEAPARIAALCSLGALFLTSLLGFPWHLASTLALGALCLAILGASDARLAVPGRLLGARALNWLPMYSQVIAMALLVAGVLAVYGASQAAKAERHLVMAARYGALIFESGDTANAKLADAKALMLEHLREGIALAPHHRTLIEPVADQLTRLRDWKNAAWVWAALSESRPYSVALMINAARADAMAGDAAKAQAWIDKARAARPDSDAWMGIAVVMAAQARDDMRAVQLGQVAVRQGLDDYAMLNAAFEAAWRTGNPDAAVAFMELRMTRYATTRQHGLILLGNLFTTGFRQPERALGYLKEALAMSTPAERPALLRQIPPIHWAALGYPNGVAASSAAAATR